ncbi:MAG: DNA mismatch repair protein MutS [Ignavibacteriales bacterium]|nr:DNA mismatch repair protein MutS [Ignavibacteriales bacterium]
MAQYSKIKLAHPDTVLLFRMGDFYETFEEDAKIASRVLGITLTKRANGAAGDVPLAGFPHHAVESYLPKLVRAGYRVAICEQIEDPKLAKGIVKREVIEIVTPGVVFSDKVLDHKKNNYLMAVNYGDGIAGVAFCDISTGDFFLFETETTRLIDQTGIIAPSEVLSPKRFREEVAATLKSAGSEARITKIDDWVFNKEYAKETLLKHFGTINLKGFGASELEVAFPAAGAILHYLQETQKANLSHLKKLSLYNPSEYMVLDWATKRNLEITYSMADGGKDGTLFAVLDKTETPMGGRLLKKWITSPLTQLAPIIQRQESVEALYNSKKTREKLKKSLANIGDIERLISRICTGRAAPREIVALKYSLLEIPEIIKILHEVDNATISKLKESLVTLEDVTSKIDLAISDNPPISLAEGGVIKRGYSIELDEMREILYSGKDWITDLQKTERERSGIPSLKISYNRVFGYYIEISNVHKEKVPPEYIRKQTLVSAERYITPDLKIYEDKVLNAEENVRTLETELFNDVRIYTASFTEIIQKDAKLIAMLDCLLSFAEAAVEYNYIKPVVNESSKIEIYDSRHPVVERILPPGEKFTSNDYNLDSAGDQIIILTGPNMAGKSVYLRQLGLLVLLAQIGSFIPASKAEIGIVDRIFTRVGASDNITAGESTFLVEMQEAANILNNATSKSLILLDEIGRGTSTFDGLSIAWSMTEYLHENPNCAAKTLFATHYHELNELAEIFTRIVNYRVQVKEYDDKVIFLHKVSPGSADHSYGIQVAMMAGLPWEVTSRAKEILANLEGKELTPYEVKKAKKIKKAAEDQGFYQMSLFEFTDDALRKEISDIKVDELTPVQALNKLDELKKKLKE